MKKSSLCNLCGDRTTYRKKSAYDRSSTACTKCAYAESMMRISDPCVRIEGKTPKECGIDEVLWVSKVLQTRKNTDKYLMGKLI